MEIVGTRNSKDIVRKRNYYSMLLMSVRSVKKDISDFTLSVPLSVNYLMPTINYFNCWELFYRQSAAKTQYE